MNWSHLLSDKIGKFIRYIYCSNKSFKEKTFLFIRNGIKANVLNNLFVGSGNLVIGDALMKHNLHVTETGFLDARNFDYRLSVDSKARDAGMDLKNGKFEKWIPKYSYHHKSSRKNRTIKGSPAIGAYEH